MTATDVRVRRLSNVSARQVIEPEQAFDFATLAPGRVLPDELSCIAGLDLDLSDAQRAQLTREELASMLTAGIRFEAVLDAVFSLDIADARDLTEPRYTYMLHEVGEETRHQRAFVRLIEQLQPRAKNPFDGPVAQFLARRGVHMLLRQRALFCVLLLAGEEIPDLLQKLASEHPGTDPLVRAVNKYHRQEEARHLAFARVDLPQRWADAGRAERARIRHLAPRMIRLLFDTMVHPGVFETVGLPGMETWRAMNRTANRRAIRFHATRPILETLCNEGILRRGRIPRGWRELCGVDRHGVPLAGDPALPQSVVELDDHRRVI
jgi:hypothetical protein